MAPSLVDTLIEKPSDSLQLLARDRYFNSAVLVPFISINGEDHLVFEKRAENIRQGSEICFPGGMHDPDTDKNCKDTAVRETVEELGIARDTIQVLGHFGTLVAPIGAFVDVFLGRLEIKGIEDINANPHEVETVFTLPFSYFINQPPETYQARVVIEPSYIDIDGREVVLLPSKELKLPPRYHKPWGKIAHRILVYPSDYGAIWGFTGEIIHDMVKKTVKNNP